MAYAYFRPSTRERKAGAGLVRYEGKLGKWAIGWTDEHGRSRQLTSDAKTKGDAERLADDLERKAERVRLGLESAPPREVTFARAVEDYLEALPPDYASKATLAGRLRGRAVPHLGKLAFSRVTAGDVMRMLAANADAAPQTREHLRMAVQGLYTWGIERAEYLRGRNPAKPPLCHRVKVPKRKPVVLAPEVLPVLTRQIPEHWRVPFLFSVGTGARKNEMLAAERKNLRPDYSSVVLVKSGRRETTKGAADREVPIPEWLRPIMQAHLEAAPRSRWLFANPAGKQWAPTVRLHDVFRRALVRAGLVQGWELLCGNRSGCGHRDEVPGVEFPGRPLCAKCGRRMRPRGIAVDVRWKDLRSTFATLALRSTGNYEFVRRMLGHVDPRTTQRYADVDRDDMARQANAVDFGRLSASARALVSGSSATSNDQRRQTTTNDNAEEGSEQ